MRHCIRSYVQVHDVGSVCAYPRRSIPDRIFVVPGSRLVVRGSQGRIPKASASENDIRGTNQSTGSKKGRQRWICSACCSTVGEDVKSRATPGT